MSDPEAIRSEGDEIKLAGELVRAVSGVMVGHGMPLSHDQMWHLMDLLRAAIPRAFAADPEAPGPGLFSDSFRYRLAHGKYTKWAADLDEDQLEALLWGIGEMGYRATWITSPLDAHESGTALRDDPAYGRARMGMDVIIEFCKGRRYSVDEVTRRVHGVLERWRESLGRPDAGGDGAGSGESFE